MRTRSNYHISQAFKEASPQMRRAIIENWDRDLVVGIGELELNALNVSCKFSRRGADRLRKNRTVLRHLVNKDIALGKKMKLILQTGGFLLPLMTATLSALPSLIWCKHVTEYAALNAQVL